MEESKGQSALVRRWVRELELADRQEKSWRKESEKIIKIYRGEQEADSDSRNNVFNILWSNVETLRPALYNSTPSPIVRRRFLDKDKVGKASSEVLERALSFAIDSYDFDDQVSLLLDDYLLPGRGITRVRYIPSFNQVEKETDDDEVEYEDELAYEEAICEHVDWEDFRHGPGRIWDEVEWIAFKHKLTKEQVEDKFSEELAKKIPYDVSYDEDKSEDEKVIENRAEVWEIWDKEKRMVLFICKNYKESTLKKEEDPLNLVDFFPTPRPLYSISTSSSLIPIPEYVMYETLSDELTRVTKRIMTTLNAVRVRGVYDSTLAEVNKLFEAGDNQMIPAENLARIIEGGGIERSIWMMPVDKFAGVLVQLYGYRQSLIQAIYEITGISDIQRGSSNAQETARAQEIKSNWGTMRLQRRQREVQRYIRDLLRLKAEIIGENFSIETLQLMTGLEYPTNEDKMQIQAIMPTLPPEQQLKYQELLQKPTWEQIKEVISNDMLRQFKVDIETDSTIAEQMSGDKKDIAELLRGVIDFINGISPAVQSGVIPTETAKTMLMAAVRRFKLGTEVEDSLDNIQQQSPQQQDNSSQIEQQKQQLEAQKMEMQHNNEMEKLQFEAKINQAEHQARMAEIQAKTQGEVIKQQAQAEGDMINGL